MKVFTNPAPVFGDFFGNSIAALGNDRVIVGAWLANTVEFNSGVAYLFDAAGNRLATFFNPTPMANAFFGAAVTSVGDDRILVGCLHNGTGVPNSGAAHLFNTNGNILTTFTNPTPLANDSFGAAIAAVGTNRVLIGAPAQDLPGAAYLFRTDGTLLTSFTNPTPENSDNFGVSVAAVGTDRVLIGASHGSSGASNAGAAYLFRTNGTLLTVFTNPVPTAEENLGISVAAMGPNKLLIGAYNNSSGATNAGVAYLFNTNGGLIATVLNPEPTQGAQFGGAVTAVGADRILIGAANENVAPTFFAGAAYLFTLGYPPIEIAGGGTNFTVTWITPEPGLILQHATNMSTPTTWSDMSGTPVESGLTNVVDLIVPAAVNSGFYRLRRP